MCRFRKIWVCSLLALLLALLLPAGTGAMAAEPANDAEPANAATAAATPGAAAAYVMELHSGETIFSQNGEQMLPPASTGKIVTALLTLDMAEDLDERTTISAQAAAVPEMSIDLRAGETLTLADLLTGALVHSGNDACFALAEAVAGSEPLFVHWLNLKAAVLGAYATQLYNPHGLPEEGHAMSVADLAHLAAYAMQHPFFAETVASKQAVFGEGESRRSYTNTNKLLWQDAHIIGIKTGTTDDAGNCLVAAYADQAAVYLSVVFHSPDRYGESLALLRQAAAEHLLLFPVKAGQALAYWPDGAGGGERLYAAEDVYILTERAAAEGIRVRWELPRRLVFLDAAGAEIASTELVKKPAGIS